jgi:hypothetical protein
METLHANACFSKSHFPILFVLFALSLHATMLKGQSDSLPQTVCKTTAQYIETTDTLVTIRLNVNNEFEYFKQEGDNFVYDIRPNIQLSNKLSFSYRYISFGIGFTPKFIPGNNDNAEQGKTKAIAFGMAVQTSHLIQEIQAAKIRGFYLHNSGDFAPGWQEGKDPYLQLPDMVMFSLKGATSYKFNPNFSLKAISSQSEIQLKSCGSFIPSLAYNYYEIDNKSKASNLQSSQKSNNFQGLVNVGYYYTLVLNSKMYISGGIIPGLGIDFTSLTTRRSDGNQHTSYKDLVVRSQEKIGLGYNSRKFLAGAEFSIAHSIRNMNQTSVKLEAKRVYFQVFAGYRFMAPKLVKRETDAVKQAVPSKFRNLLE